jgi:CCR4-NOT transcription complex subunit 3
MVDKLNTQVDVLEAESEQINVAKGRRGVKVDTERLRKIEENVEQHKFHMTKLETMLRLLENDAITTEDVRFIYLPIDMYMWRFILVYPTLFLVLFKISHK